MSESGSKRQSRAASSHQAASDKVAQLQAIGQQATKSRSFKPSGSERRSRAASSHRAASDEVAQLQAIRQQVVPRHGEASS